MNEAKTRQLMTALTKKKKKKKKKQQEIFRLIFQFYIG